MRATMAPLPGGPALRRPVRVVLTALLLGAAVPGQAAQARTSLEIVTPRVVHLHPTQISYANDSQLGLNAENSQRAFGRIEVRRRAAGDHQALAYSVESGGQSSQRVCHFIGYCGDVRVAAEPDEGLLHLATHMTLNGRSNRLQRLRIPTSDYGPHRVVVAAEDEAAQLKVFREVLVQPSPRAPDCADYPDKDPDRFACLFNRELPALGGSAAAPPVPDKLVQPAANYELVFAEEFDGEGPPGGEACRSLAALDGSVWNRGRDPCGRVDSNGRLCESVKDGHYVANRSRACGAPQIDTVGKFTYRYGYMEARYRFEPGTTHHWQNITAIVLGHRSERRYKVCEYGLGESLTNVRALTRNLEHEIDFFELIPHAKVELSHQYLNPYVVYAPDIPYAKSDKKTEFCRRGYFRGRCAAGREVTVTRGLEWTPRGYRSLIRVAGADDDFVVRSKERVSLYVKPWQPRQLGSPPGICDMNNPKHRWQRWWGGNRALRGAEKDAYFEYLVEGDPESVLEQMAISHTPVDVEVVVWGVHRSGPAPPPVRLDYIRVYQPRDRYAGMEPVYR